MKDHLLGFDIGGTKCAVILGKDGADPGDMILDKLRFDTDVGRGPYAVIDELISCARALMEKHSLAADSFRGAGVSCGGPLNAKKGVVMSPPNLPGWDDIPVTSLLGEALGIPARLANDADACAVAEWKYGAGRGCEDMVFLTFGTGMGAGLILNGRLYTGACDLAGEVGHVRLSEDGPLGYGKRGSFEGYCSGGGIADAAKSLAVELIAKGTPPLYCPDISRLDGVSAKTVAEAARTGDGAAIRVYRECGRFLGRGLSALIDILNPEMIVIGSVFARSGELMSEEMRRQIEAEALPAAAAACRIVPAMLGENIGDYAALGIAATI